MKTKISFVVGVLTVVLLACSKGQNLDKIREDGFSCKMAGGGGGFAPKPGNHCFICADSDSMSKCGANPLTSGCKEVDLKDCK